MLNDFLFWWIGTYLLMSFSRKSSQWHSKHCHFIPKWEPQVFQPATQWCGHHETKRNLRHGLLSYREVGASSSTKYLGLIQGSFTSRVSGHVEWEHCLSEKCWLRLWHGFPCHNHHSTHWWWQLFPCRYHHQICWASTTDQDNLFTMTWHTALLEQQIQALQLQIQHQPREAFYAQQPPSLLPVINALAAPMPIAPYNITPLCTQQQPLISSAYLQS